MKWRAADCFAIAGPGLGGVEARPAMISRPRDGRSAQREGRFAGAGVRAPVRSSRRPGTARPRPAHDRRSRDRRMKLYQFLIRFFRVVNPLYFADIHASGRRRVPQREPLILAANHPGSILDAILLSTQVRRPIRYLARSGLFRWPILATLFRQLGAIPVYRRHESHDHARRNIEVFERVFQVLEEGGCVGIFPEGERSPAHHVGELRTGAARMALGAEARNGYALGIRIVPVGITFENREFLMAAVLLRFGPPIAVADYAELHRTDPEAAVRRLTGDLREALRRQALHIEDLQLGELGSELATIVDHEVGLAADPATRPPLPKRWFWGVLGWYRRSTTASGQAFLQRVHSRRRIAALLARVAQHEPEAVTELRQHVERYKDHLDQTRLRHALAESYEQPVRGRWPRLKMTAYAVGLAPIALFGLVHNAVPFFLAWSIARMFRDEAVHVFAGFGLGVIAFIGSYGAFAAWLWQSTQLGAAWIAVYVAALPPTGLAALSYRRNLLVYRDRILVRTFLWNQRELARLLRHERSTILARLEELSQRYRARTRQQAT